MTNSRNCSSVACRGDIARERGTVPLGREREDPAGDLLRDHGFGRADGRDQLLEHRLLELGGEGDQRRTPFPGVAHFLDPAVVELVAAEQRELQIVVVERIAGDRERRLGSSPSGSISCSKSSSVSGPRGSGRRIRSVPRIRHRRRTYPRTPRISPSRPSHSSGSACGPASCWPWLRASSSTSGFPRALRTLSLIDGGRVTGRPLVDRARRPDRACSDVTLDGLTRHEEAEIGADGWCDVLVRDPGVRITGAGSPGS